MESLWIFIIVLVLATLLVLNVHSAYKRRVRNQLWEAKVAEACQSVKPIVEKSYSRLTEEIRDKWPLVSFNFPTLDDLMGKMGSHLGYYGASCQTVGVLAKKVLAPVVSKAVADFISYNPNFMVSEQAISGKIPDKFPRFNDQFRITEEGRSPPDWAERRRIVHDRDTGRCCRCGVIVTLERCHIHHLIRRSEGGDHSLRNLVTLCRECHSLMPEHQKVNGGPFYTSYSGSTLHTEGCYHGTRRISGSLPSLLAKGYTSCMKCMPNVPMKSLWIERFARARLSAVVRSVVAEYERELPSIPSES